MPVTNPYLQIDRLMLGDIEAAFTGRGFGHTAFDTLDKLHLSNLREAASVLSRILLRIANAKSWPAKQRSPKAVEKIKQKDPNLEIMALEAQMEKLYARRDRARKQRKK